jgi:ribosome-associated toxin RatA of RatAB toxin-antitoxin module
LTDFQDGSSDHFYRYSQAQLYSLVSDVPSYSSFIPFCTSSRVLAGKSGDAGDRTRRTQEWSPDDKPFDLEAELVVGFGGLEEKYTSRVMGKPFESVTVSCHILPAHLKESEADLLGNIGKAISFIQIPQNHM